MSVRRLSASAAGGCPGEPGWSAGHRETGSDVGMAGASRVPRARRRGCAARPARRGSGPERAASGTRTELPGAAAGAAPLRPKARPAAEASGWARYCSAQNRARTRSRALLVRFVRKALVAGGRGSWIEGERGAGTGSSPKDAYPSGTVGARGVPGVPAGTPIPSSFRLSLPSAGSFRAVPVPVPPGGCCRAAVLCSPQCPPSMGRHNSPRSIFSGSEPLFHFFSLVQGR